MSPVKEIPEIHETINVPDENGTETFYATDEAHSLSDEPIAPLAATDAAALGYPIASASDANALQDMLAQSQANEVKALRKYLGWVKAQGAKGVELQDAYQQHKERTSRLYGILTDGINGKPAARR